MSKNKKMDIIYEDKEILVVNKPSGLLTISTEKEKIKTLYHEASQYVKKQNKKNKIFIVHRLDKDTSGIIVFAKNEKIKNEYQKNWNTLVKKREYIAIVEGKMPKKKDTLKSFLKEDKNFKVYSAKTGDLAITHYEVLGYKNTYSLLKINIETGKKNQIRVQLSDIKNPIIGDKKYNAKKNPIGRLGLHASILEVKDYKWTSKLPKEFKMLFESELVEYEKKNHD